MAEKPKRTVNISKSLKALVYGNGIVLQENDQGKINTITVLRSEFSKLKKVM